MPSHPLTNFEIQEYFENEPKFNGAFPRDNMPKKNKRWRIHIKKVMNIKM